MCIRFTFFLIQLVTDLLTLMSKKDLLQVHFFFKHSMCILILCNVRIFGQFGVGKLLTCALSADLLSPGTNKVGLFIYLFLNNQNFTMIYLFTIK